MKTKTNTQLIELVYKGAFFIILFYLAGFLIPVIVGTLPTIFNYTVLVIAGALALNNALLTYNEKTNDK